MDNLKLSNYYYYHNNILSYYIQLKEETKEIIKGIDIMDDINATIKDYNKKNSSVRDYINNKINKITNSVDIEKYKETSDKFLSSIKINETSKNLSYNDISSNKQLLDNYRYAYKNYPELLVAMEKSLNELMNIIDNAVKKLDKVSNEFFNIISKDNPNHNTEEIKSACSYLNKCMSLVKKTEEIINSASSQYTYNSLKIFNNAVKVVLIFGDK